MKPKVTVYIAASLDGFIAGEGDSPDWLDRAQAMAPQGEDLGFAEFMAWVDALVIKIDTED